MEENRMYELTINALEKYLKKLYMSANEQGLFMKLVEEVGETAEILNIRAGRKVGDSDTTNELAYELADIIHYTVAIAAINNIDLSTTIIDKDKRALDKYHRDVNLEEFVNSK